MAADPKASMASGPGTGKKAMTFAQFKARIVDQIPTSVQSPSDDVLRKEYSGWSGSSSDIGGIVNKLGSAAPPVAAPQNMSNKIKAENAVHDKAGTSTVAQAQQKLEQAKAFAKLPGQAQQGAAMIQAAQNEVTLAQNQADIQAQANPTDKTTGKTVANPLKAIDTGVGDIQYFRASSSGGVINEDAMRQLMGTQIDQSTGTVFDPTDPKSVQRFSLQLQQSGKPGKNNLLSSYQDILDQTTRNYGISGTGGTTPQTMGAPDRKVSVSVRSSEVQAAQTLWGDVKGQRIDQIIHQASVLSGGDPNAWKLAAGVLAADNNWSPGTNKTTKHLVGKQAVLGSSDQTAAPSTPDTIQAGVQDILAKQRQYGSVVLAAIAHRYGDATAEYVKQNGRLPDALQDEGSRYLTTAMSGVAGDGQGKPLSSLNGNDPNATAELQAILKPQAKLITADPNAIKNAAQQSLSQILLRPAAPGELEGMTGTIQQAILDAQRKNQTNIFAKYGGGQAAGPTDTQVPTSQDMIDRAIKNSPEYKKLYAHMQAGLGSGTGTGFGTDEAAYQKLYQNAATSVLGNHDQIPNDVTRAGMEGGDTGAFVGALTGTSAAMAPTATFRDNLFKTAALINGAL